MHWCPRQTPSNGSLGPKCRTTSLEMPAFRGWEGPGEITMPAGDIASIPAMVVLSLRTTTTPAPSSQRYW